MARVIVGVNQTCMHHRHSMTIVAHGVAMVTTFGVLTVTAKMKTRTITQLSVASIGLSKRSKGRMSYTAFVLGKVKKRVKCKFTLCLAFVLRAELVKSVRTCVLPMHRLMSRLRQNQIHDDTVVLAAELEPKAIVIMNKRKCYN